ncbi:MAG TPA: strictosidine synthase [Burkholderiaceae bacterium]|jgi:hypothetical protein
MLETLSRLVGAGFGRRDAALSIPIMDGALKPNNQLEEAPVFAEREGLEDLAIGADGQLYAAAGTGVFRVTGDGRFEPLASYDRAVSALAVAPDGTLAAGLGNAVRWGVGTAAEREVAAAPGAQGFVAVGALHVRADGGLLIADASALHPGPQWRHDLMGQGRSGRVLAHDPRSGATSVLASGLAHAFGACADPQGRVVVSEAWRHRLTLLAPDRPAAPALTALPGYPARIAPARGGGFWLSVFACRTQLVEFVLREHAYRREMMRSIEPRYWVAPAFSSGADFLEPLQGGGVKQMGILKPWAPPRSYGLVVRLGADFVPKYSLHSRVGGRHHGIVAAAQRGDELFVLSKGSGRILRLSVEQASRGAAA